MNSTEADEYYYNNTDSGEYYNATYGNHQPH